MATPLSAEDEDSKPFAWHDYIPGLLFLVLALAGIFAAGWNICVTYRCFEAQGSWLHVPCEVVTVSHVQGSGRRSHDDIEIRYCYQVEGREFCGKEYDWWPSNLSAREAGECVQEIQRNPSPRCYVNPENPEESVFLAEVDWLVLLLSIGAALVLGTLGLGLLYRMLQELAQAVKRLGD